VSFIAISWLLVELSDLISYNEPMSQSFLEVGAIVRHQIEPDWGLGQIQSIIGPRITVNFENQGKVVLHGDNLPLEIVAPDCS
jgi:hypothetical protein